MDQFKILPESQFDSLSIGIKLYSYFDGFQKNEVQLFSYFSSVIFPYTKEPLSEWKYKYTIDKNGYPFSSEINSAIDLHILNGNFEEKGSVLIITPRGIKTFDNIKDLSLFNNREKAISAACTTTIMIPFREAEEALLSDQELSNSIVGINENWINQEFVIQRIMEVSNKLGVPIDNLVASSVSWIKYLSLIKPHQQ